VSVRGRWDDRRVATVAADIPRSWAAMGPTCGSSLYHAGGHSDEHEPQAEPDYEAYRNCEQHLQHWLIP